MEILIVEILLLVFAVVFAFFILRGIARFLRALFSPRYNNWIFLFFLAANIATFCLAVYHGGGGYSELQRVVPAQTAPDPSLDRHYKFAPHTLGQQKPAVAPETKSAQKPQQTWFWVKLWFLAFFLNILSIAVVWDEISHGWDRFWESWEQRPMRATTRVAPRATAAPPPATTAPGTMAAAPTTAATSIAPPTALWGRIKNRFTERFAASLTADLVAAPIVDTVMNIFSRLFKGRR